MSRHNKCPVVVSHAYQVIDQEASAGMQEALTTNGAVSVHKHAVWVEEN